jgi:hypothetical protein
MPRPRKKIHKEPINMTFTRGFKEAARVVNPDSRAFGNADSPRGRPARGEGGGERRNFVGQKRKLAVCADPQQFMSRQPRAVVAQLDRAAVF